MRHIILACFTICTVLLTLGAGCIPGTNRPNQNGAPNGDQSPTTSTQPYVPMTDPVTIHTPSAHATVESPVEISGELPGNWATEGQLYITLETDDGTVLGETTAMVDNWMTTNMVPFETMLGYTAFSEMEADIIIHKGNPSGLPENEMFVSWPVIVVTSTENLVFTNWNTVTFANMGVELMVPTALEQSTGAHGTVQFLYTGPTQREATELYDGISISLTPHQTETDTTLRGAAEAQYVEDHTSAVKESIDARIREVRIGGHVAYTYEYTSLGKINRYFVESSEGIIMLSILSPDPEGRGYGAVVNTILTSIDM